MCQSDREKREQREERFRVLYESLRLSVFAYALRRTSSREDAADVVAETFVIGWRRLEEVPEGDESLLWFYATARRVLANHHRRAQRRTALVERLAFELGDAVKNADAMGTDQMAALLALRRLDDDDRELLMLVSWEGLDSAELSRLLNAPGLRCGSGCTVRVSGWRPRWSPSTFRRNIRAPPDIHPCRPRRESEPEGSGERHERHDTHP